MLDIQILRAEAEVVAKQLALRGNQFDYGRFQRLDTERRRIQIEVETLQATRNKLSKQIGRMKAAEAQSLLSYHFAPKVQ